MKNTLLFSIAGLFLLSAPLSGASSARTPYSRLKELQLKYEDKRILTPKGITSLLSTEEYEEYLKTIDLRAC